MHDGGYYMINEPLIRGGIHKHTAADPNAIPQRVLEGVNLVQDTAWRVNTWVLDLIRECWVSGEGSGVIPDPNDEPLPKRYSDDVWDKMAKSDRAAHLYLRSQTHARNARLAGKREALLRKLEVAESFRDDDAMWFPHFMDFRGRVYPLPQDLNPQGDDVAKGLLMFAEGKPLGETGLYWLAVRLANTFGMDKLSFDDRMAWVMKNEDLITDSARDPLDGDRFWTDADDPWCFLATCREWHLAHECDNPADFPSHLPIPLDGTCNGLQHLSLMGRDPVGAVATNCSASEERHDLYQTVADEVSRLVSEDATAGVEEAHYWITNGVTRSTVKRAVMTTPYGVTNRGIRDQLIADGHVLGDNAVPAANYLQKKIVIALENTVTSSRDIMAYFQEVASILADHNIPLRWVTPTGMEITQSYWKLSETRVNTLLGRLILWDEDVDLGLSARKQTLSSAPNVIHSFDAAMLIETALQVHEDFDVSSFAFVHDSYGTHAADTDKLAYTLRAVAVQFYEVDRLEEFHDYITSYIPDEVELPEPPTRGTFDVEQVRHARYFFA